MKPVKSCRGAGEDQSGRSGAGSEAVTRRKEEDARRGEEVRSGKGSDQAAEAPFRQQKRQR